MLSKGDNRTPSPASCSLTIAYHNAVHENVASQAAIEAADFVERGELLCRHRIQLSGSLTM